MQNLKAEIKRRRTFAIISHPDAGKTTLTEKLLLYGGAINQAGSVKARKNVKHAVSDWMEIEKKRGISVTSSVLQYEFQNFCINILDTPGHQDFSEDTYRTLMAADSAVMVLDASKGVEIQTKKLFKVCLLRNIPVFTFINKMDRAAMDPFKLLEHIENELNVATYAMNWPVGSGKEFQGVYDRKSQKIIKFQSSNHGKTTAAYDSYSIDSANEILHPHFYNKLLEDIELLDVASTSFNENALANGKLTPVFFGSALTNFGVQPFLEHFLDMTSSPLPRNADTGIIDPFSPEFSAFIFKIQANMNKAHRDRIAFMRICSGKYEKGMEVFHVQANKTIKLAQSQQFMAQERELIENAYAGDVIGVYDPGVFSIGDTLCPVHKKFKFQKIPTFAPEFFARVTQVDTMKRKQFQKGIAQIAQEGAIQVFQELQSGLEEIIVGGVGELQFEVFEQRLLSEYNIKIKLQKLPYQCVRWIHDQNIDPMKLNLTSDSKRVCDQKGNYQIIFLNNWGIKWALEQNSGLQLDEIFDFNDTDA